MHADLSTVSEEDFTPEDKPQDEHGQRSTSLESDIPMRKNMLDFALG